MNMKSKTIKFVQWICGIFLALTIGFFLLLTVAHLVGAAQAKSYYQEEKECLAKNIYHESRNQPLAGQMAVALVTLNRVKDKRFPDSICEVVYQGPVRESWKKDGTMYPVRHRCQFSWWCDGKSDSITQKEIYNDIQSLVELILHRGKINIIDFTDGATHYHATYVKPDWAKMKTRTAKIEDHIFYRWVEEK